MADRLDIVVTPLHSGAAVRFPRDAARNARFRARFPKAVWGAQTRSWHIPGKTAAQRALLWAAEEEAEALRATRRRAAAAADREWEAAGRAIETKVARAAEIERKRAAALAAEDAARLKPSEDIVKRVIAKHVAMAGRDTRYAGRYMFEPDRMRAFVARGIKPGATAHPGLRLRITYLGGNRMRLAEPLATVRGPSGRYQDIEINIREVAVSDELVEEMLSALAWEEFKPRGGFGISIGVARR